MLRYLLVAACVAMGSIAFGQVNQGGNQGAQGGNQGAVPGGNQGAAPGGIMINPDGVISAADGPRANSRLLQKQLKSLAAQNLSGDMATPSDLRKVSLVRLEQECQKRIDAGEAISDELRYLAGITQLQYLFVEPQQGDLVIAGPAEGFAAMENGRVVGVESGRPVLTLDDLLVMLRLQSTSTALGCSFDPDPQRLAAAQDWNKSNNAPAAANVARRRFEKVASLLGNWNISVFGLPAGSHAAICAVEADFQMKRLALGLRKPAIRGFRSHLDLATPNENSMRRWWFAPHYDAIERSPDNTVFHLTGPRLQLLAQEELVDLQGNRSDAAFREVSTERFTKQFNRHLPQLCRQVASFAEIQNLFDLAITVALIRRHNLASEAGWHPALFLDGEQLPTSEYEIPRETPSLVNVKSARRGLLLGKISGGVTIVPDEIIASDRVRESRDLPATAAADGTTWWWD